MANKQIIKQQKVQRRKNRVRSKITGTAKRPRLNIFRSLKHTYVQLIDDGKGITLASAKDSDVKGAKGKKSEVATKVGELIAKKAQDAGIKEIVFDKSSYKFHGRIKAIADGAKKGGLKF